MTKKEVIESIKPLQSLSSLKGVNFNYSRTKNIRFFSTELEDIRGSVEPYPDEFEGFNNKKNESILKHCKKDDKGNPIQPEPNSYTFEGESKELFNAEVTKLIEEYKETLDKVEEIDKNNNELLNSEYTGEISYISKEDIPEDITGEQMDIIFPFIKED